MLAIGATNRLDTIDAALKSRFNREIGLGIPDKTARQSILRLLCCKLRLSPDFGEENWKYLAVHTPGYVGADIAALAQEAGMVAIDR